MKLYYAPGACSLADHILLEETGLPYEQERVDIRAKRTAGGEDFRAINPKGYVPALRLDDGQVLTENVAILSYLADRADGASAPGGLGRYRVLEMLSYVASEVHHAYGPLFFGGSDAEQDAARAKLEARYRLIADGMDGRGFAVGDGFTAADCYLFVTLLWAAKMQVALPDALVAYRDRLKARPSVARALADEGLA